MGIIPWVFLLATKSRYQVSLAIPCLEVVINDRWRAEFDTGYTLYRCGVSPTRHSWYIRKRGVIMPWPVVLHFPKCFLVCLSSEVMAHTTVLYHISQLPRVYTERRLVAKTMNEAPITSTKSTKPFKPLFGVVNILGMVFLSSGVGVGPHVLYTLK